MWIILAKTIPIRRIHSLCRIIHQAAPLRPKRRANRTFSKTHRMKQLHPKLPHRSRIPSSRALCSRVSDSQALHSQAPSSQVSDGQVLDRQTSDNRVLVSRTSDSRVMHSRAMGSLPHLSRSTALLRRKAMMLHSHIRTLRKISKLLRHISKAHILRLTTVIRTAIMLPTATELCRRVSMHSLISSLTEFRTFPRRKSGFRLSGWR